MLIVIVPGLMLFSFCVHVLAPCSDPVIQFRHLFGTSEGLWGPADSHDSDLCFGFRSAKVDLCSSICAFDFRSFGCI